MFTSIDNAIQQFAAGKPLLVLDDEDRENEGDLILAASKATPETVGFMIRHSSGYLCAPMSAERASELRLPLMVPDSEDPKLTAYTISCDARLGTDTGISAHDRALTANVLASGSASDLVRPGHVLPLIARDGLLAERQGHTEAAVVLTRLAGLPEVGLIGEAVHDDGSMMRTDAILEFGAAHEIAVITIDALKKYVDSLVEASPAVEMTNDAGRFTVQAWRTATAEHLTLTAPAPGSGPGDLVRVHSECLTGDVLGSHRCDCGEQLNLALRRIAAEGGTLLYMRGHEGRGIGLFEKIRAYHLQDDGADTVDANLLLGLPVDSRCYDDAAAILCSLGLTDLRLLTNNPDKHHGLARQGINVRECVPIETAPTKDNERYLRTKRDRMHHHLDLVG